MPMKMKCGRKDDQHGNIKKQDKSDYHRYPEKNHREIKKKRHQHHSATINDVSVWKFLKSISNTKILLSVICAIISIGWKIVVFESSATNKIIIKEQHKKIEDFLSWLVKNGSNISSHVTLAEFQEYGGYGLLALQPSGSSKGGDKAQDDEKEQSPHVVIRELDDLFTIPRNIIISADYVLDNFSSNRDRMIQMVTKGFPHSFLVQQDAVIAIFLMEQCGLGSNSKFKPYLDILPQEIIPRLDTFVEEDLLFLNDEYLAKIAREGRERITNFYHDQEFQTLLRRTVMKKFPNHNSTMSCFDFESFHRFMAIVSSRAMVLNGRKYLTPLADMVNYKPRSDERIKSGATQLFTLYHGLNDLDGSITVRADRDVSVGEQIFEDYGDLDNSLYLEAHGFVPDVNPFHCATIEGRQYMFNRTTSGNLDETEKKLIHVMHELGLLRSSLKGDFHYDDGVYDLIPDFCIKQDGSIDNNDALKMLTIAALSQVPELIERCIKAPTKDIMELECLHYLNKTERRRQLVQRMARQKYCDQKDALENDESLLHSLESLRWKEKVSTQRILALKFRIEEMKTLSVVGNITFGHCLHVTELDTYATSSEQNNWQESVSGLEALDNNNNSTLEHKVKRFNTYIESLRLPIVNIKASYIDETMRVGVVATHDIQEGDVYLSVPSSFVLDSDSFTINDKDSLGKRLFDSLKVNTHDGGFDVLLFCLMYEVYVRKENSEWYPYIQMLPTLKELKHKSPLFLDNDIYDYLAGSDLRLRLMELKRSAISRFRAFSKDVGMSRVLGIENMTLDKYLWAFAIIHSRSIWWNGMRHLVPLLDLVNCAEVVGSTGNIIAPHVTQKEVDHVITRASFSYKHGDQIFENYSQPNYIYFMFHGFILENNHKDCILIDRVGHLESQHVDKTESIEKRLVQNGFESLSPSFCLQDKKTLNRFSNYLRIKNNLPGDRLGLGEDVRPLIMNEIERRLLLHKSVNRFHLVRYPIATLHVMKRFIDIEYSNLHKLNLLLSTNFTGLQTSMNEAFLFLT